MRAERESAKNELFMPSALQRAIRIEVNDELFTSGEHFQIRSLVLFLFTEPWFALKNCLTGS